MDARGWCDLPPDLVREISGRLHHDAVDLARFHAVCKPWRDSRTATGTDQFLPWLVAAVKEEDGTRLEMRCVLSGSNYHSQPLLLEPWGNWVTSSGGTAFRCLTIESLRPSLHDPLTGAVAHLPLLPHALGLWEKEINPCAAIYGDGATLLYSVSYSYAKADGYGHDRVKSTAILRMALLRPGGDAQWTVVERTLEHHSYWSRHEIDLYCVTYHHGKILIVMKADDWRLVTPNSSNISGVETTKEQKSVVFGEPAYNYNYNYVLESRGEILWVSIKIPEFRRYRPGHDPYYLDVSVSVQALEEKTRWVRRDGRSLADRVLFLGTCHSLAVDAWRVPNGHGGCVYFVYQYNDAYTHGKRVFRCNLIDGKNELVQRLPQCWDYRMCLWFNPESVHITPPQEDSKGLSSKKQQQFLDPTISSPPRHVIHVERHCVPSFRVLVRNLPLTVKSTQLRLFFSEHGKVSSAEVIFYKKTGASQGIGYVTIQMTHAHQEDALAALNQLVLDGCHLKVSLIKQGEPPQRRRQNR